MKSEVDKNMKAQIIVIIIAGLLMVNILSLPVKLDLAMAAVTCVDQYNHASVIPCSDQNAIVAPNSGGGNMTAGSNMTGGNMTPPASPQSSPPPAQTQQQGWWGPCNTVQSYLLLSCSDLVNPDGTLTSQGDRAVGCIRNGAGLALAGISQNLPLPAIISGLRALEGPTGCGGIVNWDNIQSISQLELFTHLFGH